MFGKSLSSTLLAEKLCRYPAKKHSDISARLAYLFLAIRPEHGAAVEDLTAHHQDPFDRLLVAQALTEPMRLVTHDALVARYSDTVIVI